MKFEFTTLWREVYDATNILTDLRFFLKTNSEYLMLPFKKTKTNSECQFPAVKTDLTVINAMTTPMDE